MMNKPNDRRVNNKGLSAQVALVVGLISIISIIVNVSSKDGASENQLANLSQQTSSYNKRISKAEHEITSLRVALNASNSRMETMEHTIKGLVSRQEKFFSDFQDQITEMRKDNEEDSKQAQRERSEIKEEIARLDEKSKH